MAIKTISLELDAYDLLARARKHPKESFSAVVRRASWGDRQYTGRAVLEYTRERMRVDAALTELSLDRLVGVTKRSSTAGATEANQMAKADAYLVDTSYLVELEIEVKTRAEGPAIAFLRANESAAFRVSVITCGEFSAALSESDQVLGNQVLGRFELVPLSNVVVHRYAHEVGRLRSDPSTSHFSENEVWVGCTAAALGLPLLARGVERFRIVHGLQVVPL